MFGGEAAKSNQLPKHLCSCFMKSKKNSGLNLFSVLQSPQRHQAKEASAFTVNKSQQEKSILV